MGRLSIRRLFQPSASKARPSNVTSTSRSTTSETISQASTFVEAQPSDPKSEAQKSKVEVQDVKARDLWADALQKLPDEEKEIILQTCSTSKLDLLQDLWSAADQKREDCENRQVKFEFNGRQISLRDVTDKIIRWVNKFKEIGDVVVNFDPVHAALPWAGVRLLLQVATAESQQMGALLSGIEKVAYLINRCTIYEILYLHDTNPGQVAAQVAETSEWVEQSRKAAENLELALLNLYTAMLHFLGKASRLYKSVGFRVLNGSLQPDQVVGFVKDCDALESRVEIEASNCERTYIRTAHASLGESRERLEHLLVELQEPIMRTDTRVAALYTRLNESQRMDILKWVSHIQHEKIHRTAREGRTNGTGKWLLAHKRYQNWQESKISMILWLHGIPGAGKTKLVSTVVDDLLKGFGQHSNDEALAYFYCDRNQSDRRDATLILSSFVRQLSVPASGGSIQPSIEQLYVRKRETAFASGTLNFEESRDILLQLAPCYQQITLVLDALDECNKQTRQQLLDALDMLVNQSKSCVKVFISSRPDEDIKRRFGDGLNMEIKATDNRDDIAKFVDEKIENSSGWQDEITPEMKKEIRETLVDKSEGMFQWVSLQIAQLLELLPRERDIRNRLGKLPETLEEAYDEIYARICAQKGSAPDIANRAFQWVMCSCTPLSPGELVAATCQDPETDIIEPADIKITFILAACHNLLVVDQELGICRLSHLSVQEYFEKRPGCQSQANGLVAKVCLVMLNEPVTSTTMSGIVPYARLHWPTHIQRHSEGRIDSRLIALLKQFLGSMDESGPAYRRWHKTITKFLEDRESYKFPLHGIYKELIPVSIIWLGICSFGFHEILPDWWKTGPTDVNQQNHNGKPLLQLAAIGGFISVIEELLKRGADIDLMDGNGVTALHWAAGHGNEAVVKLLLDKGAEIDIRNRHGRTPLSWTARYGNDGVVKLLLDKGAELDTRDNFNQTPLLRAAEYGHFALINLLLDEGAELDIKDDFDRTPLSWASRNGSELVVKCLLDRGAKMDIRDRDSRTPLSQAAEYEQESLVKVLTLELISRGSNINMHLGADQKGVLHWAAIHAWENVVDLAVEEAGATLDQIDASGRTPLHYAADLGNILVARQLIRLGSSARIKDNAGKTAIQLAAVQGFSDVLTLFLKESDFDINQPDNEGCTLLHWAASWDWASMMKVVIDQPGVNLSKKSGYGRTALHMAALCGCPNVLRVLLELGHYDINQTDAFGNTLLHLGARVGSLEVVKEVLRHPTFDRNRQNKFGQTALDTADVYDKARTVFTFLCGANVAQRSSRASDQMTGHQVPLEAVPEDLSKALLIIPRVPTREA